MHASLDLNSEHWYVASYEDLLGEIVDIIFIRRVVDNTTDVDIAAPWLAPYLNRVPNLTFAFPSEAELQRFESKPVLTRGDLVNLMQLNYEETDHCSRAMINAIGCSNKDNKFLWSYILSRCSGRGFRGLGREWPARIDGD